MVTVRSFPTTAKAIWLITSGITGLTLPGIIDDPACLGGRFISSKPARGPLLRSLRSFDVFESFTAILLRTPETVTNTPAS